MFLSNYKKVNGTNYNGKMVDKTWWTNGGSETRNISSDSMSTFKTLNLL